MKTLLSIIASLSVLTSALACDAAKGIWGGAQTILLTLEPGVPQFVTWDYSDCWFGITYDSFYVTQPMDKKGFWANLPPSTPLTVTLHDVTTGVDYPSLFGINGNQSVCGHVLEMTLTLAATAHKPVDVQVQQSANWGGPCQ